MNAIEVGYEPNESCRISSQLPWTRPSVNSVGKSQSKRLGMMESAARNLCVAGT